MSTVITNQSGTMYNDIDAVIRILSRKNKKTRPAAFLWSNVSNDVHKKILYLISSELNLANPRFIASKHLEKHKFAFLNGHSLNGLYSYYKNRLPRKQGVHIIENVCNIFSVPEVSEEDWIEFIKHNNIFSWNNIPLEVKRKILLLACKELGYHHPLFFANDDFSKTFDFLNGKTLTGFYTYFRNICTDIRGSIIKHMCEMLNIEISESDWISYIVSSSTNIFWDIVPVRVIRNILYKACESLGYSNPRMMSIDDLKIGLDFLNGISLYSFASRYFGVKRNGVRNVDFICDIYEIPSLTYDEWIFMICNNNNFKWELLPNEFLGNLLYAKAREINKPNPRMLMYEDFTKPCSFINNKTLVSLYTFHRQNLKDKNIDTVNHMCNIASIPPLELSQWISIISRSKSKISWSGVPKHIKKEIIIRCSEELNMKNPRFMSYKNFCSTRYKFLNGKTLSGLYSNYSINNDIDQSSLVQYICDDLGIERLNIDDWVNMIANTDMCRWEHIPYKVQRELVIMASSEIGLWHPRLMGTREFDSIEFKFLNNKTLSGLYYHYAGKLKNTDTQINQYIFDVLNIPKIDVNPKTGRLATLDNDSHKKYFDSLANMKSFINKYIELYDLESLCKKYTTIRNAKKAGIYIKGLVTILAPMSKKEYIDYIYNIIKTVPRDYFGLKKPRNGDYRLNKSDLYEIAGLDTNEVKENTEISFLNPDLVEERDKSDVIKELKVFVDLHKIKIDQFHRVNCKFLTTFGNSYIFNVPVSFYPGDILTSNTGFELEVVECREHKVNNEYILELKSTIEISDEASLITTLTKDSNDSIIVSFLSKLCDDIINDNISPLMSVVLGLKKEKKLSCDDLVSFGREEYFNSDIIENPAQKQSVSLACTLDGKNHCLAIIQGPPGTGKTTLIREIALQYYKRKKSILILAKTNVAVDNILEKLIDDNVRVLRTGNNIERKSTLPYAFAVSTSNPQYMDEIYDKNKIVLGTPMGYYLDKNKTNDKFDLLVIDEASQIDVPETLFALDMSDKCVIIGDHLQIPPFPIQNEVIAEYDPDMDLATRERLQTSLFERLITDTYRFNSVFLNINYRTRNPKMVSFISDLIYDGKLYPNLSSEYYNLPNLKRKKLFPKQTIEIIDTSKLVDIQARLETEVNSTYYNLSEAMLSVKKAIELIKLGESLEKICIITPYKAHAEKIQEIFMQHSKYFGAYQNALKSFIQNNIYTIDSFQGREEENIIINWVRSNYGLPGTPTKTGFLRDYRRVNVALSRAKKRLVLIGDYDTLTKSDNLKVRHIFTMIKNLKNEEKIVF